MTAAAVVTIGYERRTVDDLVEELHAHDVEVLVDVRLNPMSRKSGFSKRRLAEALASAGVDYVHEPSLGNPQDNRAGFHAGEPAALARYEDSMRTTGSDALGRLHALVRERVAALFCYERDAAICHRSVVARHLQVDVIDL